MVFGFALEALLAKGIGREMHGKNLDGDGAVQPCISGAVHFAHPARPQRPPSPHTAQVLSPH